MRYTEPNRPTPRKKLNMHPIANERSLKNDSCTIGWGARRVLQTKRPPLRTQRENRPMQIGESHPSCGDCFSPIMRLASETAIKTNDKPSNALLSPNFFLCRGNRYGVAELAISRGTTLMRNSQCQE